MQKCDVLSPGLEARSRFDTLPAKHALDVGDRDGARLHAGPGGL